MESILVTGGAGFIGSHTCLGLIKKGYNLYIIDSFINSSELSLVNVLKILEKENLDAEEYINVIEGDIKNKSEIRSVFLKAIKDRKPIKSVLHFAGLKSVAESVKNPGLYWKTNLISSLNLVEIMIEFNCFTLVFSSSATVYSFNNKSPISENGLLGPNNPYGNTKLAIEQLLNDFFYSNDKKLKIANLRYFNPVGAHPSGFIGEDPKGTPNNIFPIISKVAVGEYKKLSVYGNDWPTIDGTGVRDYIHVMDLAEGHIKMLEFLIKNEPQVVNLNLGTGIGTSVLELIKTYEEVNNIKVPFKFAMRRSGDLAELVADNSYAKKLLNWSVKKDLKDMCKDSFNWQLKNPNGFNRY
tara:strand:+ start:272 stop:1333 length:1062 start_codon:yes stop_codon:yes gene_type:complete